MMGLRTQKTSKDSPKPQRIDNMDTTTSSQEKDRAEATTSKASKGTSIIIRKADAKIIK